MSKKFNLLLHTSNKRYDDGRREVNASSDDSRISWRILSFSPFVEESSEYLQVGDVLRLFHKEAEGYIINGRPIESPTKDRQSQFPYSTKDIRYPRALILSPISVFLEANSSQESKFPSQTPINVSNKSNINSSLRKTTAASHLHSHSLWIIEREKSNRGGIVRFGERYRFRHLTTGRYLAAEEISPFKSIASRSFLDSTCN